jgi:hypothetical protein
MRFTILSLLSALTLAGCEGAATDDPADDPADPADPADPSDDTDVAADDTDAAPAPRVAEMEPANGAEGVLPDAVIRVRFTEDMDLASVAAAVSSDALAGAFTLSWDDARTLVITPDAPLPVMAADEVVRGYTVDVRVDTTAQSAAGMALAAPFYGDFEVARSTTLSLTAEPGMCGRVGADGTALTATLQVGDTPGNVAFRGYLSFDGSLLPPVVAVRQAVVAVPYSGVIGTPFTVLGDLTIDGMRYPTFGAELYAAAPAIPGVVGHAASADGGTYVIDVTPIADVALMDRTTYGNRVQLRMAFATATDFDGSTDWVMFQLDETPPELDLDLLVP